MKFSEEILKTYASPLSTSEDEKCKHAIGEIRKALEQLDYYPTTQDILPIEQGTLSYSTTVKKRYSSEELQIFIQGSYANNTCVKGESDVDIAVVRTDLYDSEFGKEFKPATFLFKNREKAMAFKSAIENALRRQFPLHIHRGNKSIKVDGNTYRKDVDTVPSIALKYYNQSDMNNYVHYQEGITIYADDGEIINNFPKQHIRNGKKKNSSTGLRYKKMVRIAKKMKLIMEDCGYKSASDISSFGIESLLWNVPDEVYTNYTSYKFIFDDVVQYVYDNRLLFGMYREANGIKRLCPTTQELEKYRKFANDLHSFYQYEL